MKLKTVEERHYKRFRRKVFLNPQQAILRQMG